MGKKYILGVLIFVLMISSVMALDCEYVFDDFDDEAYSSSFWDITEGTGDTTFDSSRIFSSIQDSEISIKKNMSDTNFSSFVNFSMSFDFYNTSNPQIYLCDNFECGTSDMLFFSINYLQERVEVLGCSPYFPATNTISVNGTFDFDVDIDLVNDIAYMDWDNGYWIDSFDISACNFGNINSVVIGQLEPTFKLDSVKFFQSNTTDISSASSCDNYYVPVGSCNESWQVNYGACESGDRRLKYYTDNNSCGTFDNLPVDHNTYLYDCDFCVEDWQEGYTDCEIDDTMEKFYTDNNNCNEYNDLPLDNGTTMGCNYCSEDIYLYQDECSYNGTGFFGYQEYSDNNYYSCCSITGIFADCSILYDPYNVSGIAECEGYSEDFEIEYDDDILFDINPEDRVFWKLFINDPNSTEDYDCISYVKNIENGIVGSTIQVNPARTQRSERTFTFKTKYDDREFFHTKNNIGSVYFTREDLVFDNRPYLFGVECVNGEQKLNAERVVYPNYESIHTPQTILIWAKNNTLSLIVGFAIIFLIAIFLGVLYKKYREIR